ncbi:MAG TPA: histidine--tRNA ligase [Brumimicrobium sp.]|nr:histidine--tRNA ligase [Brumimicrobium sp.]
MAEKPSIPKGTRDYLPFQVNRRNYIFDTIKTVFKKYGFSPIETPSFEHSSTLMGKYGEEGDRLIFRILNSGNKLKKVDLNALEEENLPRFANSLSEKALRYDLTVPFARFVVQYQNDLVFPFKRYQIQPVWRADRPQKGRYQEFYQCDVDVVGSDSLLFEVDFIQIVDEVLSNLKVPDFTIHINNRKILSGIAEIIGEKDKIIDITVAIDKLDKIGEEGVIKELQEKGVGLQAITQITPLLSMKGDNEKMIEFMRDFLKDSEVGKKGLEEIEFVFEKTALLGLKSAKLEFNITLARGLNYYTGAIFEVTANSVQMGSICGGGRYDDLTGLFGLKGLSGVGISFGADRIYDVLSELELFPDDINQKIQFLFINFGEKEADFALPILKKIRDLGIVAEIYPEAAKLKKQFKYADDKNAQYTVVIGESELATNSLTVKDMTSGEQETISVEEFYKKHCR